MYATWESFNVHIAARFFSSNSLIYVALVEGLILWIVKYSSFAGHLISPIKEKTNKMITELGIYYVTNMIAFQYRLIMIYIVYKSDRVLW